MHPILFLWRWQPVHLATLPEERFERTGGLDSHHQRPRVVADVRPDVRDHAGHEQRITGAQREPLVANLKGEVALDRIEPLVLLVVEMSRRPAFTHVGVLEDKVSPISVISGDLDLQWNDAPDHHLFLKAVLATGHVETLLCSHVYSFPKFSPLERPVPIVAYVARRTLLPRIVLLRTLANTECKGLQRISFDDQGEAVAVAVAVVAGTVFSGVGTVFSGAARVSSTVTVRAGGRGGAASSRLPALMRPRRNPTSSPKSSPKANVTNHIRTALSSLTVILPGLALLLPIVLYPFTHASITLARRLGAPEVSPPECSTAQDDRCKRA